MGGTPHPQDGLPPPKSAGWDTPHQQDGVPPNPGPRSGWGGVTPKWNSMVCTCCAAGGMPLAFTQEDFLVHTEFEWEWYGNGIKLTYIISCGSFH